MAHHEWEAMAAELTADTGTPWTFQHDCGGCWALTANTAGGMRMVMTWCDDALHPDDSPADVDDHNGFCLTVSTPDPEHAYGASEDLHYERALSADDVATLLPDVVARF